MVRNALAFTGRSVVISGKIPRGRCCRRRESFYAVRDRHTDVTLCRSNCHVAMAGSTRSPRTAMPWLLPAGAFLLVRCVLGIKDGVDRTHRGIPAGVIETVMRPLGIASMFHESHPT
jgi:hypothetical protein